MFRSSLSFVAVAAVLSLGLPALAATTPLSAQESAPNWSGCFVGANVGGAFSKQAFFESYNSSVLGLSDGGHTASGAMGGGQIGCDYQVASRLVVGVRGMLDGGNLAGSNVGNPTAFFSPSQPYSFRTRIDSIASVTGKVGFLVAPTSEIYGLAGVAQVHSAFACDGPSCSPTYSASDMHSGLEAGIGFKQMLPHNLDFFAEINRIWLRSRTFDFVDGQGGSSGYFGETIQQSVNSIVAGVDYRFTFGFLKPLIGR